VRLCRFLQPAENFDGRAEPVGWRAPGFVKGPGWTPALVQPGWGDVPLQARSTRPIAIAEGLVPALVTVLGPGHLFVDFGREIQGGLSIDFPSTSTSGLQVKSSTVCALRGMGGLICTYCAHCVGVGAPW
jgi:hypothetical protein